MKLYNYMEDAVKDELDKLLTDIEDICKCEKCRLDMAAFALNRLNSQYVVSNKGRMYTKLKELNTQSRVDIMTNLTKAILNVSKKPRH